MLVVERSTVIAAAPADVWDLIGTVDGTDGELLPFVIRSRPRSLRATSLHHACIGRTLAARWVLLLGVLPVARTRSILTGRRPGELAAWSTRSWMIADHRHVRTLRARGERTEISDHVSFVLWSPLARIPGVASLMVALVGAMLAHRQARLVSRFAVGHDALEKGRARAVKPVVLPRLHSRMTDGPPACSMTSKSSS